MLLLFASVIILWNNLCSGSKCNSLCCDNFELRDGKCVECEKGFTSVKQAPCERCDFEMYGKRCAEKCICTSIERCNHVMGCVNISSSVRYTTENEIEDTSMLPSHNTTDSKDHDDANLRPISIYIMCAGTLTCLLVIGLFGMVYKRKLTSKKKGKRDMKMNEMFKNSFKI